MNPKQSNAHSVVCLLVVNRITELPSIAINSILLSTRADVVVGYIDERDIHYLPRSERISFQKLDIKSIGLPLIETNESNYSGWFTDNFFRIVQLKWILIQNQLHSNYDFVFYSDLDVVWLSDIAVHIENYFYSFHEVDALFQSFTYYPEFPKLCMGFAAFRNSKRVLKLIEEGHKIHTEQLKVNHRFGDDDAITLLYRNLNYPSWIRELPQTSIAVGSSINLHTKKSVFPGLTGIDPIIFHANFAIGETNKRLLIRLALKKNLRKKLGVTFSLKWRILVMAKKIKMFITSLFK